METRAKELCESDTVRPTITYRINRASVSVGSPLPLASWIEKGTGIYGPYGTPIVPTESNVLVFPGGGGGFVFARYVRGQKARPFLKPALQAVRE